MLEEDISGDDIIDAALGELPARDALRYILHPWCMSYVVRPGYIEISAESKGDNLTQRFYDVSDLVNGAVAKNELARLIQGNVNASWDVGGGYESVSFWGGVMIVNASRFTHEDTERLLIRLRQFPSSTLKTNYPRGGELIE